MKKLYVFGLSLLVAFMAEANISSIAPSSAKVGFSITKFKINDDVKGSFKDFSGNYNFDPKSLSLSDVSVTIVASSVDTKEAERDDNLRSRPGFFEVKKYPEIRFISKDKQTFKLELNKAIAVTGQLTIKGVSKEVDLMVTYLGDKSGQPQFTASTTINRVDFGVSYNKAYKGSVIESLKAKFANKLLGDEVKIDIQIQ